MNRLSTRIADTATDTATGTTIGNGPGTGVGALGCTVAGSVTSSTENRSTENRSTENASTDNGTIEHDGRGLPPCTGDDQAGETGLRVLGRRSSRAGDAGAVTTQLVIATPLLLAMLMFSVQVALWMHAVHIAQTSAAQALSAARAEGGNAAAGQAQADTLLAQLGTGVLIGPRVSVTRTGNRVSAQVSGTAQMLIPGVHLPVHATAAGPADAWSSP